MKYQLKIGQEVTTVEMEGPDSTQKIRALINDQPWEFSYQSLSPHQIGLNLNGETVMAYLVHEPKGKQVFIKGRVYRVAEIDAFPGRTGRKRQPEDSPEEVTPPMPSVVVRLLVEEGDWVTPGQGLIVVSAMKMETTLKAPKGGKIVKINTALQAKVMPGDRLIEIQEGVEANG